MLYRKRSLKQKIEYYCTLYEKNRARMQELKINGCAICGYDKCIDALEFHHVNPKNKKFPLSIANMCYKADKILDEVQKCILFCANCHREIHYEEKNSCPNCKKCEKCKKCKRGGK